MASIVRKRVSELVVDKLMRSLLDRRRSFMSEMGVASAARVEAEEEDRKPSFVRCCGFVHVRSLTIFIVAFELLYIFYQATIGVMQWVDNRIPDGLAWPAWSVALFLGVIAILLLIIGLLKRLPHLLIPHLIIQVLFAFTMLVLSVFCVYSLWAGTSLSIRLAVMADEPEVLEAYGSRPPPAFSVKGATDFVVAIVSVMALCYFLSALFNLYCFYAVLGCYRWLLWETTPVPVGPAPRPTTRASPDFHPAFVVNGGIPKPCNGQPIRDTEC